MARSSQSERVHRINAAHQLLQDNVAFAEAAEVLSKRFSVGKRQAYRYLKEACQSSPPLSTPDDKAVLTVRLPVNLIDQLRNQLRPTGQSLSDFVCQALRRALQEQRPRQRGRTPS
jgi:hypothetical protein